MKSKLIYIIPIIILFVAIGLMSISKPSLVCKRYEKFQLRSYSGIVIRKYFDVENHAYPTIVLRESMSSNTRINLIYDVNNVYRRIQIGDTLRKNRGDSYFVKNIEDTLYVDFGENCED